MEHGQRERKKIKKKHLNWTLAKRKILKKLKNNAHFLHHKLADLRYYSALNLAHLGPEGVEDGHVVRLLHQLLLHEAEHRQRVSEQHLNKPREYIMRFS